MHAPSPEKRQKKLSYRPQLIAGALTASKRTKNGHHPGGLVRLLSRLFCRETIGRCRREICACRRPLHLSDQDGPNKPEKRVS